MGWCNILFFLPSANDFVTFSHQFCFQVILEMDSYFFRSEAIINQRLIGGLGPGSWIPRNPPIERDCYLRTPGYWIPNHRINWANFPPTTVDGSEIRRSPVNYGKYSLLFTGCHKVSYMLGGCGWFLPSTVSIIYSEIMFLPKTDETFLIEHTWILNMILWVYIDTDTHRKSMFANVFSGGLPRPRKLPAQKMGDSHVFLLLKLYLP